jgi:hypothetical protein
MMGQNRMNRMDQDKMKAYKIAYITDRLDLTATEAQKFWPIYNEISDKIDSFKKQTRKEVVKQLRAEGGPENISDEKAWSIIQRDFDTQKKILAFEEELVNKLKGFLPYRKILKLKIAEREFKKDLFKKLRERRKKFNKD